MLSIAVKITWMLVDGCMMSCSLWIRPCRGVRINISWESCLIQSGSLPPSLEGFSGRCLIKLTNGTWFRLDGRLVWWLFQYGVTAPLSGSALVGAVVRPTRREGSNSVSDLLFDVTFAGLYVWLCSFHVFGNGWVEVSFCNVRVSC